MNINSPENVEQLKLHDGFVVKIGTDLVLPQSGPNNSNEIEANPSGIDQNTINQIGRQVVDLCDKKHNVAIVTSGFVAAGRAVAKEEEKPGKVDLHEEQRLAALGAMHVLGGWSVACSGKEVGQVLVTKNELSMEPERTDALWTIHALMRHGQLPIINNNDTVSLSELKHSKFTHNDELSATLASLMASDDELFGENIKLLILTNVDGVLADYPDPQSLIPEIEDIDEFLHLTNTPGSTGGTGGMRGKLEAMKIAQAAGVPIWIANGREPEVIQKAMNGQTGTYIVPAKR